MLARLPAAWDRGRAGAGVPHGRTVAEHPAHPPRIRRHIQEGLRFVTGDAALRAVCLASAAFRFFFSAVTIGCLLFPPRALHICRARSSG
ncbi:hypothetical protein GCM10023100_63180 [Actinocorallia cavernae]|uniref:Uncharacterized protein n=2 Tax=Actinomycetes TaxID=1760 RepID=A0ABP8T5T5_9ACTN